MTIASVSPAVALAIGFVLLGCRENTALPSSGTVVRQTSAQEAEDLDGWKTAKWGMTPDEVRRALGGEAKNQILPTFTKDEWNLNVAGLKLPDGDDLHLKVDVHFVFDENRKLGGVTLAPGPEDHGPLTLNMLFDYFDKQLSAKYGAPTRRHVTDGLARSKLSEVVWSLRLTTITLSQAKYPDPAQWDINSCHVSYKPRRKNDVL